MEMEALATRPMEPAFVVPTGVQEAAAVGAGHLEATNSNKALNFNSLDVVVVTNVTQRVPMFITKELLAIVGVIGLGLIVTDTVTDALFAVGVPTSDAEMVIEGLLQAGVAVFVNELTENAIVTVCSL